MNHRILLIGDDDALLKTRAQVLSDFNPEEVDSLNAADKLAKNYYDLIVICQSVHEERLQPIIHQVRRFKPTCKLLLVRFPGAQENPGVDTLDATKLLDPGWLKKRVAEILTRGEPTQNLLEAV